MPRLVVLIACGLALQGCAQTHTIMHQPRSEASSSAKLALEYQTQTNEKILAALRDRRYADAIRATRSSHASQTEIDFAVGELALQGLVDSQSIQRPLESVPQALALIEAAALKRHPQAISALAAIFAVGLRDAANQTILVAPDSKLNGCWEVAKSQPEQSAKCVSMRGERH